MEKDTACSSSEDDATPGFLFKSECGKFQAVSLQRNDGEHSMTINKIGFWLLSFPLHLRGRTGRD